MLQLNLMKLNWAEEGRSFWLNRIIPMQRTESSIFVTDQRILS